MVCLRSPAKHSEVHPALGQKVACAIVSLQLVHAVIHTSAVLPATPASALRLRGFQYGVCRVMKIALAKIILTRDSLKKEVFALALMLEEIRCQ